MNLTSFLPHVLPSAPECPDSLALDHILKAARTFAARTLIWQFVPRTILSTIAQANYTLQLEPYTELVRILSCEVDGTEYLVPGGLKGRKMARDGVGNLCVMSGANDFSLSPTPSFAGRSILTDIAVKPSLDATTWPDDLEEHVTEIADGAMATLLMLPKQPWTDAGIASTHASKFEQRIHTVAFKVQKGLGRAHQNSKVVWF